MTDEQPPASAHSTWAPRSTIDRVILGGLLLLGAYLIVRALPPNSHDFRVFYTAAERLWAGEEIYRLADGSTPFKYWPGFVYLIAPIALLPLAWAQIVWAALNVGAFFATLVMVIGPLFPTRRYPIALGATLLVSNSMMDHFVDGQINLILLAMIVAGFVLIGRGRRAADGGAALITTAAYIKLYPMLFLVMLPIKRAWRLMAVATAALIVLTVLPMAFGGLDPYRQWMAILADSGNHLDLRQIANQSLLGMYLRFVHDGALATTLYRVTALVVLLAIALGMPRTPLRGIDTRFVLDFTMVTCAMLLVSPLTWMHYLVFQLPFMVLIVGELMIPASRGRLAWIGLGLILISAFPTMTTVGRAASYTIHFLSNHTLSSVLVLGYCIYRRRLGPDRDPDEA